MKICCLRDPSCFLSISSLLNFWFSYLPLPLSPLRPVNPPPALSSIPPLYHASPPLLLESKPPAHFLCPLFKLTAFWERIKPWGWFFSASLSVREDGDECLLCVGWGGGPGRGEKEGMWIDPVRFGPFPRHPELEVG